MKGRVQKRGYLLIECIAYIGILAVVSGLAFSAYYRTQRNSRDLIRNSDDIVRVLKAGERWRADIRAATASPKLVENGNETTLRIPQKSGEVVYRFTEGTVWRKTNEGTKAVAVLREVKASHLYMDVGKKISSWRWELELASPQKVVRIRPLFTFQAVTTTNG